MVNIEATNIERGVTVNPAKKVKISKWEDLVRNAKEVEPKVDANEKTAQPDFDVSVKPEWEVVNTSFENVDVERNAKPIRVANESFNNMELRGSSVREANDIEIPDTDYSVPSFDSEKKESLTDYGYSEVFSDAVENTYSDINTKNFVEPNFEVPEFDSYEPEENSIEVQNDEKTKDEIQDEVDFEEMIRKALDESYSKEEKKVEEKENYSEVFEQPKINEEPKYEEVKDTEEFGISASNLQINDLMQELAQLSETNDSLKGSIANINDGNMKLERSIAGIERETNSYNEESLRTVRELILKAKEENEKLCQQKENAINARNNLKDKLIAVDETNLGAKKYYDSLSQKRKDYLFDMLSENDYQNTEEEENVKRFTA